jgi:hypothetical protein
MLQYYDTYKKILTIPYTYNQELIDIPTDTLQIIFQERYNNKYSKFNQKIKENVLPLILTHLVFGFEFNQEIKENVFPQSLTHLTFGISFNQEIKENVLPLSLTHLTFGHYFNQEIKKNVLPLSLTHLVFGINFNQEIKENVLPLSLTELVFGISFNQEIKENVLPKNLTFLHLSNKFNKNIKIPLSVKLLSCDVECAILNNIPEFIQNIVIVLFYNNNNKYNIPITNIPITVKKIYFIGPDTYINLLEKIPFDCVVININKQLLNNSDNRTIINLYKN